MPVSTLPRLPGAGRFLAWMAAVLAAGFAGLLVAGLRVFRTRIRETETLFDEGPKRST
jgi:hypothetical protein